MTTEILIIAEHDGSAVDPITLDLVSWGARIASRKNWQLGALVIGADLSAISQAMRELPVDVIYTLDDPALRTYNSAFYVPAIAQSLKEVAPRLILLGHTYLGIEMSSGLAATLDAVLWNNCRTIEATESGYIASRPVSGGAYSCTIEIESGSCNVITMQRGSSAAPAAAVSKVPEIIALSPQVDAGATAIRVTAETSATFSDDITKSELLVAVGRGIGQQSQLPPYLDLAQTLKGSIAASRPIVDMGWLPVDYQVGISGRTVRPKVYLACGISGSMQHLAGMRDSRLIIAINEDSNAPIFQLAHYGVVGDINAIVPALINEAQTRSSDAGKAP